MLLGNRIRELRQTKNKTLKQVSEHTKLSVSYLSDVERGRTLPSLETLQSLTSYFEINLADLLEGVDFAGEKTNLGLPPGLGELLAEEPWNKEITEDWIKLLAKIDLRGQRPRTKRDWLELYLSIKRILENH